MNLELNNFEKEALKWLLIKGMELTNSNKKYDIFCDLHKRLVKNLDIADVVWRSEQLVCDCQDYENGLISNYCPIHNDNPYTPD